MNLKWIGAVLVMVGCGGWGLLVCTQHNRRMKLLRQLIGALDFMECELQYRHTPLPQLCGRVAAQTQGRIRILFAVLTRELESQVAPDAQRCMAAALGQCAELPHDIYNLCKDLGSTLGRFDMPGQLSGLDGVRRECRRQLEQLSQNKDVRLRSYQTLGLCAGAAMAILFI